MKGRTLIKNARIVGSTIYEGSILIEDGLIVDILGVNDHPEVQASVDAEGLYAAPGLIELHTHGAGGYDYMDASAQAYDKACDMHLNHGVTTILPTTVASNTQEYLATLEAFEMAKKRRENIQCLYGMHLEGPFFPIQRAGGMDLRYIMDPDPKLYRMLNESRDHAIARWTAAPELPGSLEFGDYCKENNILASIGHTDATIDHVKAAMEHGFNHVTHLYSDMSTITRKSGFRVMGVLECAYAFKDLNVELISDACHLPPDMMKMIYSLIGEERLQICSDSIRPAGTDAKEVIVGSLENGQKGIIEDGVAKFLDRSAFYGSIQIGDSLIYNWVKKAGVSLDSAIRMMSLNPARLLHIDDHKGSLDKSKDADIILLDDQIKVQKVFYKGEQVR